MEQTFGPVAGSSLLPFSFIIIYSSFLLIVLIGLYIYSCKRTPLLCFLDKLKSLSKSFIILNVFLILLSLSLIAYWLIPAPKISNTTPIYESKTFPLTNKIEFFFDKPVNRKSLEENISPQTPGHWAFENPLYATHLYRKLVFYPTYSLRPDTTYKIKLSGIENFLSLSKPYQYEFDFTTQSAPKFVAINPSNGQREVKVSEKILVILDKKNDDISEFIFKFTPEIEYEVRQNKEKTNYTISPKENLIKGKEYNLKIFKSDTIFNLEEKKIVERSDAELVYNGNFITEKSISEPVNTPSNLVTILPPDGLVSVNVQSPIKIIFDQEVDRDSAQQKFSLSPQAEGNFSWEGNTLIFIPKKPLEFTTSYNVSYENTESRFTTQDATIKLAVPFYLQKYTLSCEIAALRMALNYRGKNVTEDDLIPKVGFDNTPHNVNIWGDPNKAFVGNINGTQMQDGYGVHWGPIAKVAQTYTKASDFQNWNIKNLTNAILNNNPVIVWVYSAGGWPTSWNTPDGTKIYAVRDEHAIVVVGFVGEKENPSEIIVNDPLHGQVYWSIAEFEKRWNIFNQSGVEIY